MIKVTKFEISLRISIALRFLLIGIVALLFVTAANAQEIVLGFDSHNLAWGDDEIIVGGSIVVHGGTITSMHPSGQLIGVINNDPEKSQGVLSLGLVIKGVLPTKQQQMTYLENWLTIRTKHSIDINKCPSESCPIQMEGELILERPSGNDPSQEHKIPLTTSNFIFDQKPAS